MNFIDRLTKTIFVALIVAAFCWSAVLMFDILKWLLEVGLSFRSLALAVVGVIACIALPAGLIVLYRLAFEEW